MPRRSAYEPLRAGVDEGAGVGIVGSREDELGGPEILDPAVLEDVDGAAHRLNDREVMGDEDHCHRPLGDGVLQETDDLGLNRDVERGRRLVRDDDLRPCQQGASEQTRCFWPPES